MIVGLDLYSHHFDATKGFENVTPGVYASFDPRPTGDLRCAPTFGTYKNSERGLSVHGGCAFAFGRYFRVYAGVVTGYKAGPLPLLLPSAIVPLWKNDTNLSVSFLPKMDSGGSAVLHFGLERKF